ncbi:hypothetical protein [Corynebacterium diphtheriae]|uniref:hypothetical protein n=1 Tax=Corynebacterium diphtheriae TaxID=1717 RepID=UPI003CC7C518
MALPVLECIDCVSGVRAWLCVEWDVFTTMAWLGLAGRLPPFTPEKTALHTKSAQMAGLEAIWCEALRKILRNTPV